MKVSDAYPSNYLKAADLKDRDVVVTIESVDLEKVGQGADQDTKLVIGFRGKDKKLVCNKTNAQVIEDLYGDETDDWIGKQITLTSREVEFQGKMMLAIRVSLKKPATAAGPKQAPTPADVNIDVQSDDIPF